MIIMEIKNIAAIFILAILAGSAFAVVSINAPVPGGADVAGGKSIVYYLEELNGKLLGQEQEIKQEQEQVAIEIESSANTVEKISEPGAAMTNNNRANKVKWSNLLKGQDAVIVFPKVDIKGEEKQLALSFGDRTLISGGVAWLVVSVNNEPIECYHSGGKILNYLGLSVGTFFSKYRPSTLVFGWGEGQELCEATAYSNRYALDATLSSSGSYKQFELVSPLIPYVCDGEVFSNDDATTEDGKSILRVTC